MRNYLKIVCLAVEVRQRVPWTGRCDSHTEKCLYITLKDVVKQYTSKVHRVPEYDLFVIIGPNVTTVLLILVYLVNHS